MTTPHASPTATPPRPEAARGRSPLITVSIFLLVIAAVVAIAGILSRRHAQVALAGSTSANARPTVTLQSPTMGHAGQDIVLPGNLEAYSLAPIYARTTGYVRAWYRDIGTHVKKGELLAVIETPELDQQLAVAKADLATAQANARIAGTTASRYKDLVGQDAVSQQDTDSAVNLMEARQTQVASAQANLKRLEELQSFERITAPFDGVVTARNVEVGQLISANGSTTAAGAGVNSTPREMFDVAAMQRLRVYVNVPQIYSPNIHSGMKATLTLPQFPRKAFQGQVVRSSDAIDPATRTLLIEVDVDNRDGQLLPGSYAEVHLHALAAAPALLVPSAALVLRPEGVSVVTVDGKGNAHFTHVVMGRDLGNSVEILDGLKPDQKIVTIPPDSLIEGEAVRVVASSKGPNS